MSEQYYVAVPDNNSDWQDDCSMLKGPNGFECCLTEPEDRSWCRDGNGAVVELNRLAAENKKLKDALAIAGDIDELLADLPDVPSRQHNLNKRVIAKRLDELPREQFLDQYAQWMCVLQNRAAPGRGRIGHELRQT